MFAVAAAVQNGGMVVGLAVAPLALAQGSAVTALGLSALACLAGAAVAGVALLKRAPEGEDLWDAEPLIDPGDGELEPVPAGGDGSRGRVESARRTESARAETRPRS